MKLTNNFTLEELIKSETAEKYGIDNTPSEKVIQNLTKLAETILQPIRDELQTPIRVSSGYRSPELNQKIGGVKSSQHTDGSASDLTLGTKNRNKILFSVIVRMIKEGKIKVGQLIDEYNYSWIHVSLPREKKINNQILHIR